MRIPEHPTQVRRMLEARRARLAATGPILAATLTQVRKRCGQPACRCAHGEPHLAWRLTYKAHGKTRNVHVPLALLDEVRSWIQEHKRIKALLAEAHQLAVALVRTHTRHQRLKDGRV
jgi:hypothetical protein